MIGARPPEADRTAVRRTEASLIGARPPEADRTAVRRTEASR
jgi:hypothetical protein